MVGFFHVSFLMVSSSAFLLARRSWFSDEVRFSFTFWRRAMALSISSMAALNLRLALS